MVVLAVLAGAVLSAACRTVDPVGDECRGIESSPYGWYESDHSRRWIIPAGAGHPAAVALDEKTFVVFDQRSERIWTGSKGHSIEIVEATCEGVRRFRLHGDEGTALYRRIERGYRTSEVELRSGDVLLRGLLLKSENPRAGVVFIHGAGTSDRDNVWYLTLAEHLANNGIDVLLPDKRGSGRSGGDWRRATFEVLATDAIDAVERLGDEPDARRPIGVLGISQGGWVVPIAASRSERVDFAISMVGAVVPLAEQQKHLLSTTASAMGLTADSRESLARLAGLAERYLRSGSGWDEYQEQRRRLAEGPLAPLVAAFPADREDWQWSWGRPIFDFDPLPLWSALEVPALAVFGEDDPNVPTRVSVERLRRDAPQVEVLSLPGRGHGLQTPEGTLDPR
ncbi:MAG TPA: alpha/beta fold hydrolase, partial [Longimicrobiaceae bacterium]|nr:alpha/beta fold hydrolase [Longimicrobiaceae bacterium]